jgi:hypothetical protein
MQYCVKEYLQNIKKGQSPDQLQKFEMFNGFGELKLRSDYRESQ